jgi:pantothenate kinase
VGKSLFAEALVALTPGSVAVPMDGFHLADVTLDAQGLRDRKGAPETFDARGYAALLHRLGERAPWPVYAPGFARDLEQPLAGAITVPPEADVVVTEGNYLLLDRPEWRAVRAELDEVWFLLTDEQVRRARLVDRHVAFGKEPDVARAWVDRVDQPNADLVAAACRRADRVVDLTDWVP